MCFKRCTKWVWYHARVLKKVSHLAPLYDDKGGDSNDSNADSNDESNTMFSTVLKIVEYSDSETSPSKVMVTEASDYAQSESPQHTHYKLHDSVFREIQYTDSENEERVEVSDFVKNYVEETEDTSPDSKSDSGTEAKVTEVSQTDPYETESQTDEPGNNQYTSVESDTDYSVRNRRTRH